MYTLIQLKDLLTTAYKAARPFLVSLDGVPLEELGICRLTRTKGDCSIILICKLSFCNLFDGDGSINSEICASGRFL